MSCNSTYYQKYHRIVNKEMQRHGFDVSVVRVLKGTYNPTNSSIINTEQIIPCRAMMFDLTLQSNGDSTRYNTLIEMGDKQLLIQPNKSDNYYQDKEVVKLEPNKDYVIIDDRKYKIITFKQINPNNSDAIIWDCYIRG